MKYDIVGVQDYHGVVTLFNVVDENKKVLAAFPTFNDAVIWIDYDGPETLHFPIE